MRPLLPHNRPMLVARLRTPIVFLAVAQGSDNTMLPLSREWLNRRRARAYNFLRTTVHTPLSRTPKENSLAKQPVTVNAPTSTSPTCRYNLFAPTIIRRSQRHPLRRCVAVLAVDRNVYGLHLNVNLCSFPVE